MAAAALPNAPDHISATRNAAPPIAPKQPKWTRDLTQVIHPAAMIIPFVNVGTPSAGALV